MSKMSDSKLSRSEFMTREMTKFTDLQKAYFKQFVGDCLMNRFSTEESLLYLKDRLGVELEEDEFDYLKVHLKKDLKRNMEYLRRHEYAYIQEYFDRIEEMRLISKRLWKLVEENPHNPILQKECLSELCKSTIAVADFYQSIKELDQASAALKEESDAISASSPETTPTPPEVESSEALKEESETISASSPESPETTPTPPEVEPSEALKEESDTISTNSPESPETTPTPPPEVEIPQQYTPKKIAKYTSEGKLVTVGN
jgi:hypothetical protein